MSYALIASFFTYSEITQVVTGQVFKRIWVFIFGVELPKLQHFFRFTVTKCSAVCRLLAKDCN